MPRPRPVRRKFRRCESVAWARRGYQSSGTVIVRPSLRTTVRSFLPTLTSFARWSFNSGEVAMPTGKYCRPLLNYQCFDLIHVALRKALVPSKSYLWLEPKFGFAVMTLNMNLWRFSSLVRVEESVRTKSEDARHFCLTSMVKHLQGRKPLYGYCLLQNAGHGATAPTVSCASCMGRSLCR